MSSALVEAMQSRLASLLDGGSVFGRRQATVEGDSVTGAVPGLVGRVVLRHDVDVRLRRDGFRQKAGDVGGSRQSTGQHEMADEQSAARDTAFIHDQIADLAVHFFDGSLVDCRVVADERELLPDGGVGVLHIGHVDVDQAVHQAERLGRVVAAGVVDDGQPQSRLDGDRQSHDDLWDDVRRRNQVDIVCSLLLQIEHHRRQALRRHRSPGHALADVVVLTILAVQIAARKEYRAGAVVPTQDVLFAVVRAVAGDVGRRADATGAGALRAVDATVVAAKMAVMQRGLGCGDALPKFTVLQQWQIKRI